MASIVAIHSFRGGTGKSNLSANLACTVAAQGYRVGVLDTDIASPGIHVLFGVDESTLPRTLNDFLWGNCGIEEAAVDVSACFASLVAPGAKQGSLYLIPASIDTGAIAKVLHEGYDVGLLNDGIVALNKFFNLDFIFVDTHPGVNEETLLSIAISDFTLLVLRPDQQDFQGTAVTIELARQLDVSNLLLVVNKAHSATDRSALKQMIEEKLMAPIAEVITLSDDMVRFGSSGLYCVQFPTHPYSASVRNIAELLVTSVSASDGVADRTPA